MYMYKQMHNTVLPLLFYLSTNTIKYLKHMIIVLLKYVCYCLIQYTYNEVSSTEALQKNYYSQMVSFSF